MFNAIKSFMQSQDPNGTWYECNTDEASYILETLENWVDDGLPLTPRIQQYMEYLKTC